MQTFHEGMRIVQTLTAHDFQMPTDAELPNPMHREVARIYAERRDFPTLEVLDAVALFAQPELLDTPPPSNSPLCPLRAPESLTRTPCWARSPCSNRRHGLNMSESP